MYLSSIPLAPRFAPLSHEMGEGPGERAVARPQVLTRTLSPTPLRAPRLGLQAQPAPAARTVVREILPSPRERERVLSWACERAVKSLPASGRERIGRRPRIATESEKLRNHNAPTRNQTESPQRRFQ